ncbi:DNA repair protein [Deinococcus sp.]|uniref:DNA repair protein n=1 Tax=Deinococcus sp. TaxID=47478 RepID=UPI0025C6816B|nr:DNA repair protein [Deinococcus sp.]
MARAKIKDDSATETAFRPFEVFDILMSTAAVDSQIQALADSEADRKTLNAALTEALSTAQQRWGLGLHHLKHEAQLTEDGSDITLLVDGRAVADLSAGYEALAQAYEPMRAADENGLSLWGALPEGHRVPADAPFAQLKVLIEEARDFETHWIAGRSGTFHRLWRSGEHLFIEVTRPVSAQAALSDAAWDVITSIKDRAFQRELMRRSEEVGMLGALLAARHPSAGANLARLPEAHFAVQATVHRISGEESRNPEQYRTQLRNASAELDEAQGHITKQLSEVLRHGLTSR